MRNKEKSKYDDFNNITSFENLYNAHRSCRSGKLWKDSAAAYELRALECTIYLKYLLESGKYKISPYHEFEVNERGKVRQIKSTKYKDRVVQKSMNDNIFKPYITKKFVYENGASQEGKGTDFQIDLLRCHLQEEVRKNGVNSYILIGDFHDYFNSFPHKTLDELYSKYFTDDRILALIKHIHDSIPGDTGSPLGNQLSQNDALLIANGIDHYIKENLHIRGYGRYMDDFYLIHHDKEYLKRCLDVINKMAGELGLELNTHKTKIVPITAGFNFLGFHVYVTGSCKVVMRIKSKSKARERQKIRKQKKKVLNEEMTFKDAMESYAAWRAHAARGDTYYMLLEMDLYFYGQFFDYLDESQKATYRKLKHKNEVRKEKRRKTKNGKTTK